MSTIVELDKLSNMQYYDLMKPVYQQSFPDDWKANLEIVTGKQ